MAWTKAGTETLTSASLNLDLGATTAMGKNQFTQYITHVLNDGTGNSNDAAPAYTLDNVSTAQYTNRATDNLGTEHTFTAQNMMYNSSSTQKDDYFVVAEIASIDGQQIYWQSLLCDKNSGGNSNPNKCESVNSYTGTTQFTRLDNYNNRGSTVGYEYDTGSNATALGSDGTESMIIQDGAIYYDTDLNKEYVLYNNTWTEV